MSDGGGVGWGGGGVEEDGWLSDEEVEVKRAKTAARPRKAGLRRREDDDDEEEDSDDDGSRREFNTGDNNRTSSDRSSGGEGEGGSPQPSSGTHGKTIDERRLDRAIASIRGNGQTNSKGTLFPPRHRYAAGSASPKPASTTVLDLPKPQRKPLAKSNKKNITHKQAAVASNSSTASRPPSRASTTPEGSKSQSASSSSTSSPKKKASRAKRAETPSSSSAFRRRSNKKTTAARSPTPASSSRKSKPGHKHNESAQMLILKDTDLGETDYGDRKIWQTHPEERINVRDMVTQVVRGGTCAPLAKNLQRWLLKNKTWWIAEPPGARRSSKKSRRQKDDHQGLLANLLDLSANKLGADMVAVAEQIKSHAERGEKALTKHDYTTSNVQFRKALNTLRHLRQAASSPAPPKTQNGDPQLLSSYGGGTFGASSD